MKTINVNRLEALMNHLRNGKPIHKHFKFSVFHRDFMFWSDQESAVKEGYCGFAGCAVGEAPAVFPEHWVIKTDVFGSKGPLLKVGSSKDSLRDAEKFFRLTYNQARHLFFPNQQAKAYGNKDRLKLPGDSTKEQVAANLERFIAWARKHNKRIAKSR